MGCSGPGVWGGVILSSRSQRTPIIGDSQSDGYCRHSGFLLRRARLIRNGASSCMPMTLASVAVGCHYEQP
jgi:hypothetical protein